jgi:pimeloyl-ACP methyl ester carboxylesterase
MNPVATPGGANGNARSAATAPLVLVHGYLGGRGQWTELASALAGLFPVITIDLPGFSGAAHAQAPSTIDDFAESVIAELDAGHVDRFLLLGHSMGGMIAQEIAHRVPRRVERLVLYGTGPLGRMPDRFETLEESLDRLDRDGVESTARRIAATWFVRGEHDPGFPLVSRIGAMASAAAARSALHAMAAWDGRAHLPALTMPSLIIWGDEDRSYRWHQVEALWSGLGNGSLAVVPGASHAVHLEKPEIFTAILKDYLLSEPRPAASPGAP